MPPSAERSGRFRLRTRTSGGGLRPGYRCQPERSARYLLIFVMDQAPDARMHETLTFPPPWGQGAAQQPSGHRQLLAMAVAGVLVATRHSERALRRAKRCRSSFSKDASRPQPNLKLQDTPKYAARGRQGVAPPYLSPNASVPVSEFERLVAMPGYRKVLSTYGIPQRLWPVPGRGHRDTRPSQSDWPFDEWTRRPNVGKSVRSNVACWPTPKFEKVVVESIGRHFQSGAWLQGAKLSTVYVDNLVDNAPTQALC
jgi:hypothetical protein